MAGRTPSNSSPFSPELQTFVVTKYDPLLAIVRELNARLQAAEKGNLYTLFLLLIYTEECIHACMQMQQQQLLLHLLLLVVLLLTIIED